MAESELPIDSVEKNYAMSTVLDEVVYTFVVRWNGRASSWFFDLYDVDGEIIIAGVRIVTGVMLGRRSTDPRMPKGAIMAHDLSGEGLDAGRDDLGTRVRLYYYPAADLEAEE